MRRVLVIAALLAGSAPAHADDNVDLGTTWFQETRAGGLGGLTVIHPQVDLGVDLGEHFGLDAGWSADAVARDLESWLIDDAAWRAARERLQAMEPPGAAERCARALLAACGEAVLCPS